MKAVEKKDKIIEGVDFEYFDINPEAKEVIIFFHGAVRYFLSEERVVANRQELVEGNDDFFRAFENYRIILPIVNEKFNWLEVDSVFIQKLHRFLNKLEINYDRLTISGFSDGGTGAYKIFYLYPSGFRKLLMFNAFPDHKGFAGKIDYNDFKSDENRIIYISQFDDKVIPYEFALKEYRKQKIFNDHTFMKIFEGDHKFDQYTYEDFLLIRKMLEDSASSPTKELSNVPLDVMLLDNKLMEVYYFRKKVGKKFGFDPEYMHYGFTRKQASKINKYLNGKSYPADKVKVTGSDRPDIRYHILLTDISKDDYEVDLPDFSVISAY